MPAMVKTGQDNCEHSLVGFFVGKRIGFLVVRKHLENK